MARILRMEGGGWGERLDPPGDAYEREAILSYLEWGLGRVIGEDPARARELVEGLGSIASMLRERLRR